MKYLPPDLVKILATRKMTSTRSALGTRQGSHISQFKGHGLEFDEFRPYTPGDDPRLIDWQVYARTDKYQIRQFRQERDLEVLIIVDASASMNFAEDGAISKFEYAKHLAMPLAFVTLTGGDSLSVAFASETNHHLVQVGSNKRLGTIAEYLSEGTAAKRPPLEHTVAKIADRTKPQKCFLISDFFYPIEEIVAAANLLSKSHCELCFVEIITDFEINLPLDEGKYIFNALEQPSENNEAREVDEEFIVQYRQNIANHRRALDKFCHQSAISRIHANPAISIATVLSENFSRLGIT